MLALLVAAATAAHVYVHVEPERLEVTGGAAHTVLHVRSPVEPRLSASAGTISNLRRENAEEWTADWSGPRKKAPATAILAAVADGHVSWTTLPIPHRGRPATPRLHVVLLEDRVLADREQKVHVRIFATDENGKPLSRPKIVLQPGRGEVSRLERHSPGEMWTTWTIPQGPTGTVRLRAALAQYPESVAEAALEARTIPAVAPAPAPATLVAAPGTELALRPAAPAPPSRALALAPLAVGAALGVTSNFARLTSPVAALSASWRTRRLGPELALTGELAWSFVSRQQSVQLGTAQARDDFFALSAQLSFRKTLGIGTTAWGGAGPSLEIVSSRMQLTGQPRISESALVPGAIVSLGIEHRFRSAVPFAEVRWSIHRDPGLSTLSGAVSAFTFVVGNHFELL